VKKSILLFAFLLFFSLKVFAVFEPVANLSSSQIKRVVVSPFEPALIYATSKNSLYQSQDSGASFTKLSVFKDEEVQHLFFDPYFANIVYIVTSRHLYRWKERLEVLFSAPDEEVIYSAARYKERIYVGTSLGLHFAIEDALIWHKLKKLDETTVYHIEPTEENIYLATDKGVYLLGLKDRIKRLLVLRKDSDEVDQLLTAKVIKADVFDKSRLWLGTSRGLYRSLNSGKSWRKLVSGGIASLAINSIVQTALQANTVYLSTNRGFFKFNFKNGSSQQIFEGLDSSYIWWAAFDSKGAIYLATARGLFSQNYFTSAYNSDRQNVLIEEPSILEVQQAALRYNEVHPEKIVEWRRRLKFRALVPDLSLDYDKTVTYDSGSDKYHVGPRDWGISLSWDLADLIWNNYEDDVDTRSRLNTQLRLDIIDEINRVYYERLRLKNEIEKKAFSKEELFIKKLRLEELTAILDGYTGGHFSKRRKELNG